MAFLSPVPLSTSQVLRPTTQSRRRTPPRAKKSTRANPASPEASPSNPPTETAPTSLKQRLSAAVSPLNRGLAIDADAEVLTPEEAVVEDLITELEGLNTTSEPTRSDYLAGTWRLLYTSSSITRFFGGVTGLQRILPGGEIGEIKQIIDMEDATSKYVETVKFELPVLGVKEMVAVAQGAIRETSDVRLLWEPEKVSIAWFSWFADGWKTLRAFQISDTTYLDDTLRITRGATGSVHVYQRD